MWHNNHQLCFIAIVFFLFIFFSFNFTNLERCQLVLKRKISHFCRCFESDVSFFLSLTHMNVQNRLLLIY